MSMKLKLKKGDQVIVIAGKDKGKVGAITKVIPAEKKVVVTNVNLCVKHIKGNANTPSTIEKKELPLHISNVSYYLADKKTASRIGYKFEGEANNKVRFNKKTQEIIDA